MIFLLHPTVHKPLNSSASQKNKKSNILLRNFLDFWGDSLYLYPWEYQLESMTMKKIILLTTAAVLLSPIAAKANQKSSILVGGTFVLERKLTGSSKDVGGEAILALYDNENFISYGLETYYTYKVWNGLQIAPGLRASYAPEHKFEASKNTPNLLSTWQIEPRLNLGYEVQLGSAFTMTPFLGLGIEASIYQAENANKKKEWTADWKPLGIVGARFAYNYFYASLGAHFDLMSTEVGKGKIVEPANLHKWGFEVSLGAEF